MLKQLAVLSCIVLLSFAAKDSIKQNIVNSYGKKSKNDQQKLTCYERAGQQGDSVILRNYAPYLDNYNFNNRAASCCFQGMYVICS